MILWVHPLLQMLAILVSLYVLYLGWLRFSFAHLGRAGVVFPWQRHVLAGTWVLASWGTGLFFGLAVVWLHWERVFITGLHSRVALAMLPLIIFGLGSGLYMDRVKHKRVALPLAHAVVNTLLVALALLQVYTGMLVLKNLVLD